MSAETGNWLDELETYLQEKYDLELKKAYGVGLLVSLRVDDFAASKGIKAIFTIFDAKNTLVADTRGHIWCDVEEDVKEFVASYGIEEEPSFDSEMGSYDRELVWEGIANIAAAAFWEGFGDTGSGVDWAAVGERLKRNGEALLEAWLAEFKVRAKVRNAMPGIEQESVGLFEVKAVKDWELWELKALASPLRLEVKLSGQRLFLRAIVPDPSFKEWRTGLERSYGAEGGLTWLQNWVSKQHTERVKLRFAC